MTIYNKMQKASIVNVLLQYPNTYWKDIVKPEYEDRTKLKPHVDAVNKIVMGTGGTPTIPCSSVKARAVISKGPLLRLSGARATA